MTSTRLPGKVLLEAFDNYSMLEYMIERVKSAQKVDQIIVATTQNRDDDKIVDLCKNINIEYYGGSENDVLEKFMKLINIVIQI